MAQDVRSPIVSGGPETREEVKSAMRHAGLLN
jgi:hypothetical protein